MRRALSLVAFGVGGLIVGVVGTWIVARPAPAPALPGTTAILTIDPPALSQVPADGSSGIDDVWQRQINDHVFRLRQHVGALANHRDIEGTEWYASFSDAERRLSALEKSLHVEHVSGTSMVLINVDVEPTADAKALANVLVRSYVKSAEGEALREHFNRTQVLYGAVRQLVSDETDAELRLAQADDPSETRERQLELDLLRARRAQLELDLADQRLLRDKGLCPITVVRLATDPDAADG